MRREQLGETTWELYGQTYDFHVQLENGRWVCDAFRSAQRDADSAHVESFEADSLDEAIQLCEEFDAGY